MILLVHTICHVVRCCPACFKTIVKPFFYTDFDYGLLRLPDVDSQQGMLTLPRHLIPPLVYPGVCVCYALIFCIFFWGGGGGFGGGEKFFNFVGGGGGGGVKGEL